MFGFVCVCVVYKKEKLRRGDIPDEEDGFDKYTSP